MRTVKVFKVGVLTISQVRKGDLLEVKDFTHSVNLVKKGFSVAEDIQQCMLPH